MGDISGRRSLGLIIGLLVVLIVLVIHREDGADRAAGTRRHRRAARPLPPHARAGPALLIPFIDRLEPLIDLREQVVSFPPQPVITEDNLVVSIDSVIYFQVTDAKAATYEIANYIQASSS